VNCCGNGERLLLLLLLLLMLLLLMLLPQIALFHIKRAVDACG
jgi:hypothetical protein